MDVIAYRIVKDRLSGIDLGFAILNDIDVTGLTVLVGRIIGNVDLFPFVPVLIPETEICLPLVNGEVPEKVGKSRITVLPHVICKKRMIVGVVRIVLRCISLRDDGVSREIKDQSALLGIKDLIKFLIQTVFSYHLTDCNKRPCPETAALNSYSLRRKVSLIFVCPYFIKQEI